MIQIPLKSGSSMPALGLGTWELRGNDCAMAVKEALQLGYRHIDTAEFYGNEDVIGRELRASGVPRKELFITTKVWTTHHKAYDFKKAVEASLSRLGLPEVDLLLIHWPNHDVPLAETMGALCQAAKEGKTKAIGVSNFDTALIKAAVSLASIPLSVNQVKLNLLEPQKELLNYANTHGLHITAYTPLGRGNFLLNNTLSETARKHGKTPAQTALRWLLQQGLSAVPKARGERHLRENIELFDFELSQDEMKALSHLSGG